MRQEGCSADAVIRIQYYTYKKPQDYFSPAAFATGFIGERQETAMKIDRMLEIIIYLVNHDNVSASYLAERFGVSVRTIQRDMVSISSIGIPVYSVGGKYGGYSILPTYKMKNLNIREEEQQMIRKALESLATSYTNTTLDGLLEKYNAIVEKEGGQKVFWDFSVSRENKKVQDTNRLLEKAIQDRRLINFSYQKADGETSDQKVEPLAIHYKWYAWYLFAYSEYRQAYRTYKIARMRDIRTEERRGTKEHGDIRERMKESETAYYQTCIAIEVHFSEKETGLMEEFFPDCPIERLKDEQCRIFIHVPPGERLWKALLLSFGDRVRVVGPEVYKKELIQTAQQFLSNYDI